MKEKVVVLGMGGTISSVISDSGLTPGKTSFDLVSLIPEVLEKYIIEPKEVMSIDSSNLQPSQWTILTKAIFSELKKPNIRGIVIIHGTDQLVYSSSATAFAIKSNVPIVFTGAQIPLSTIGSDGRKNLIDSIRIAAESDIAETVIVFNSKIFRAVRTVKLREYDLDAFESVDPTYIGDIAADIRIYDRFINKRSNQNPIYNPLPDTKVALLKLFPGMDPSILSQIINLGYQGLILEAFGAGNVPTQINSLIPLIKKLSQEGIPIVITSQCIFGTTELIYQTGKLAHQAGAISGYDLTPEAAIIKLMYALNLYHSLEDIEFYMHQNLVGELNFQINQTVG